MTKDFRVFLAPEDELKPVLCGLLAGALNHHRGVLDTNLWHNMNSLHSLICDFFYYLGILAQYQSVANRPIIWSFKLA